MTDVARPALSRQIATTADGIDITRGHLGPLLVPVDSVLRNRGLGDLTIYEQVLSDPEVKATFAQRQLAVTQLEWQVDAGGDKRIDKQAAEFAREQLQAIGWDRVTSLMLYGVFYGYAVSELIYAADGSRVVIDQVRVRNRRRFRFGRDMDLRLLTMQNMFDGLPAEAPYFWWFSAGADHDDEPYGLGLAHYLYWPVLFKRADIKFWLIFVEKFAQPTAVGKYDHQTATDTEKQRLLAAVQAVQTDSGIIMPKDMMIDLIEAARSGTSDYEALHGVMNETIQKVVLGQTASTQGTPGKLGNDQLQTTVREDLIKADADLICESFSLGPLKWLTEWNFPGAALPRVYRVTEQPEDLNTRAERDVKIGELGFRPSLLYIQETYGGEWTESAPAPVDPLDPAAGPPAPAFAEGALPDPAARMAEQLERKIAPLAEPWLDQIRAAVDGTESLEALQEALLALAPAMSLDEYSAVLAEALTAATLAGRYEVSERTGRE